MAAYDGFTIKAKFPAVNPPPKAGEILIVRDATDTKKDISGLVGGKSFPPFTKAGTPVTVPVTPLLYLKAHNQGTAFQFGMTPMVTVTSVKAFPGKTCILTRMLSSDNTWQEAPFVVGHITGKTVVFNSEGGGVIKFPANGTLYLAIACLNQ